MSLTCASVLLSVYLRHLRCKSRHKLAPLLPSLPYEADLQNSFTQTTEKDEINGLKWLCEITNKIELDQGLDDVLEAVLSAGTKLLSTDHVVIYIWSREDQEDSHRMASTGLPEESASLIHCWIKEISVCEGITAFDDVTSIHGLDEPIRTALEAEGIRSALIMKLNRNNETIGTLAALYKSPQRFSAYIHQIAEALATEAAAAVNYAALLETSRNLVSELEEANRKLTGQATSDGLTGLANHRTFHQRLGNEIRRAERYGETFAVAMLDLDRFKSLNDSFGHKHGDVALQTIASEIQKSLRDTDFPARYGGEEFAVILPHTPKQQAFHALERIRNRIQYISSLNRQVTVSIGLCEFPADGTRPDELIEKADKALYHAKITGRNRICVWGSEDNGTAERESKVSPKSDTRILVVEDEHHHRGECAGLLSSVGYTVCPAKTEDQALDFLRSFRFDLIFVEKGYIDSRDTVSLSSITDIHPDIPIIRVSDGVSLELARDIVQRGTSDVLIRPVDAFELSIAAERAIEHRKSGQKKLVTQDSTLLLQTIDAMISSAEFGNGGHSAAVTQLCLEMADAVHLSAEDRSTLELAARLHDVGKLISPDTYHHPAAGSQIVGTNTELAVAADVIRHHHERLDGSGYPDNLKSEAIPKLSRILAVADAFVEMSNGAFSDRVLQELEEKAPSQFDEEAVQALVKIISAKSASHEDAA